MTPEDLQSANVNPETGLATDYLNHFNEAIMLFEMAIDMPEMGSELSGWSPVSYIDHFDHSGFQKKEIVIAAYTEAVDAIRRPFDDACSAAATRFQEAIGVLERTDAGDPARAHLLSGELDGLKSAIARLDALIHGRPIQNASD